MAFRRVKIKDCLYTDGGWACVLPAKICREKGCRNVVSSDVWWRASVARKSGFHTNGRFADQIYSRQYMDAVKNSDLVIHPPIPAMGILPGQQGLRSLIRSGEAEATKTMAGWHPVIA